MSTVPTPADDDDYPDPVGLAAAAARYLNKTGYSSARITAANSDAVYAATRALIHALVPDEDLLLPGGGWISGTSTGGGE